LTKRHPGLAVDVTAHLLEAGARTIGGTSGGTLLVTALVTVLVQDYGWSVPERRTPLSDHNTLNRRTSKRP